MPSPGGLHAVRLLIFNQARYEDRTFIYQPKDHVLGQVLQGQAARQVVRIFSNVVAVEAGTFLWLLGDMPRMRSKYRHPESAMWKEAGVLTAALYMNASYLRLNCCAIGRNGAHELPLLGDAFVDFVPLGGCIVGRK